MVTDKTKLNSSSIVLSIMSFLVLFVTFLTLDTSVSAAMVQGSTSYSDGTVTKSGVSGTSITVRATGAYPFASYRLMSGKNQCSTDLVAVNSTIATAGLDGAIGGVTGPMNRTAGTWDICFADTYSATPIMITCVISFTVTVAPTLTPTSTPTSVPSVTPTRVPTVVPTVGATVVPTAIPTIVTCGLKSQGDANCDGRINLIDFESWRKEFVGEVTTKSADFDSSGKVDMIDFEIWRKGFYATTTSPTITAGVTAGVTASPTPILTLTPTAVPTAVPTIAPTVGPSVVPTTTSRGCTINGAAGSYISGTTGNDVICAGGNNYVFGQGGDDIIYSGGGSFIFGDDGNDTLHAGPGSNYLFGGNGNDTINGAGTGNVIDGGSGTDTCVSTSSDIKINCEQ